MGKLLTLVGTLFNSDLPLISGDQVDRSPTKVSIRFASVPGQGVCVCFARAYMQLNI